MFALTSLLFSKAEGVAGPSGTVAPLASKVILADYIHGAMPSNSV
jgi:hypothetical protein